MNPTGLRPHRPASVSFPIWSTTASMLVTDPAALPEATLTLRAELTAVDHAASRFRPDSELQLIVARPGVEHPLSAALNDLVAAALRMAQATSGLVDPTVAAAVVGLGYDADITVVRNRAASMNPVQPAPGTAGIEHDPMRRTLRLPAGVGLDLAATAKAVAADRAASRIAAQVGCGVLVNLGGDCAMAGPTPPGGWRIAVSDDHRTALLRPDQVVCMTNGGLATSSIAGRSWRRGNRTVHHIVDPRTGENPEPYWRTVSAVAGCTTDANAAAVAAIVLGRQAPDWLTARDIPARLVHVEGRVTRVGGWPEDDRRAA